MAGSAFVVDGTSDGEAEGTMDGTSDGMAEGTMDGTLKGAVDGMSEGLDGLHLGFRGSMRSHTLQVSGEESIGPGQKDGRGSAAVQISAA